MKIQFLYHPENDQHIALQIIGASGLHQSYSLEGLRIADIDLDNNDLYEAIHSSDVLILLIGSTFNKIIPMIWINAIQNQKALLGISIHSIPDEWGETRKKNNIWDTQVNQNGTMISDLFVTYSMPEGEDAIPFIKNNIGMWCKEAIKNADSNYGTT